MSADEPSRPRPAEMLRMLEDAVKSGNMPRAVSLGLELTHREPDDPEAWKLLSLAWERTGSQGLSVMGLERLAELQPERSDLRATLVRGNLLMGRPAEMLEEMRSLKDNLARRPRRGGDQLQRKATIELAETFLRIGRLDEARDQLATLTDLGLSSPRMLMIMAKIDAAAGDRESAIRNLSRLIDDGTVPKGMRLQGHFELARILDRMGRYDEAFELVRTAKSDQSLDLEPFDRERHVSETDRIIETFDAGRIQALADSGLASERAVFIVGMPRSGTTLTEQIIAAHPSGAGLGERREPMALARLIEHEVEAGFPECCTPVPSGLLEKYATIYLDMLAHFAGDASRVTNKALGLDRFVGLISMLLPRSHMVFVNRNPLDNILSTYLHPLPGKLYPWSRTLEDIALVRMEFDRLVAHWMEVLDRPFFRLDYDSLTESPEPVIRGLIESLGLPFDDDCLAFHQTRRLVVTPSFDQVDQPINRHAVNRWKNYEKHLTGIMDLFPR
ncbi:MAG: sulfotransferase [Planctomycetota bacterium]|nr:sulfotransferase [Planctomycetota bacterium]